MTNAELAILSLIIEAPRHGYEIEQIIEQRGMREWTEIGFSSIYYQLKRLEKSGWVEGQAQQERGPGPARRVYHVTPDGLGAWRDATLRLLSEPSASYRSFLLGLSNLPGIPRDQALPALRQYGERLTERRLRIEQRMREQAPLPRHVEILFEFSLVLIDAQLEWLEQLIAELQAGDLLAPTRP
jgi:DNA-binding PadR family transcriptional regulator